MIGINTSIAGLYVAFLPPVGRRTPQTPDHFINKMFRCGVGPGLVSLGPVGLVNAPPAAGGACLVERSGTVAAVVGRRLPRVSRAGRSARGGVVSPCHVAVAQSRGGGRHRS